MKLPFFGKRKIPIFYIASMARSGETLLLKCLNQHPRLVISHNLNFRDTKYEQELFKVLLNYKEKGINIHNKYLKRTHKVDKNSILIVKQGVWEHKTSFNGFVLVRNPVSVYASLRVYDIKEHGPDIEQSWKKYRVPRFIAWFKNIDESLIDEFIQLPPIEQFCMFYNRRMLPLSGLGLPIIYYEKFVTKPEKYLKKICNYIGIKFIKSMLAISSANDINKYHGNFQPMRHIDTGSLHKYKEIITPDEFKQITFLTKEVTDTFAYEMTWDNISINKK